MHERLKEIRSSQGMNQSDFAKSLGMGQSTLGMLEVGKRDILDRHIKTICSIYNVNEDWLRTGNGEMFNETDDTIIAELAAEYKLDNLDKLIIEHYLNLDNDARKVIKNEAFLIAEKIMSLKETATQTVDPIEEELEDYRLELEAEKKGLLASGELDEKGKIG